MSENKLPSGIDRLVGQRIRWRRRELKLTQEKLGEMLSLTFQQVQKYELGVNRVSAGRLFEISSVLGTPITYFYEGAGDLLTDIVGHLAEDEDARAPVMNTETLDLVAAFQKIEDNSLRKSILNTVRAAASAFETKVSH
jgi:transcriptional regulator with XRE-family HTH domain